LKRLVDIKNALKPFVHRYCMPVAAPAYKGLMRVRCMVESCRDAARANDGVYPPAGLRYRVHGSPALESFISVGRQCSMDIESAVKRAGEEVKGLSPVLDFGCGCGRTLGWFMGRPGLELHGTDIDPDTAGWCAKNLPLGRFHVNGAMPPLPFNDGAFGLVYAVSVFTHLNEEMQAAWMAELARIIRPGGLALLTFHGKRCAATLPGSYREKIAADGYLYLKTGITEGIFPEWYQSAYQTEEYVRRVCPAGFEVVEYTDGGMAGWQDLAVLRRKKVK
jgi:SAM-dependent methyltransferase